MYFVLVHNPDRRATLVLPFEHPEPAIEQLEQIELLLDLRSRVEVVLFQAESLDVLRQTHSSYFRASTVEDHGSFEQARELMSA